MYILSDIFFQVIQNYVRMNEKTHRVRLQDDVLPEFLRFITLMQEVMPYANGAHIQEAKIKFQGDLIV